VTPLSSGGLIEGVGTANKKIGRVEPLWLSRVLMATKMMCPCWEKADKRRHPRVPTHHPLVFFRTQPSLFQQHYIHLLLTTMPCLCHDKYRIGDISISRSAQGKFPHSRGNVFDPYPKNTTIIDRLDGPGNGYLDLYQNDLYNEDFLWGTAIQTARCPASIFVVLRSSTACLQYVATPRRDIATQSPASLYLLSSLYLPLVS